MKVDVAPARHDVARFLACDLDELQRRDDVQKPQGRWLAVDADRGVGLATVFDRPDGRTFVSIRSESAPAAALLLRTLVAEVDARLHISVHHDDDVLLGAVQQLGFEPEVVSEAFAVPFAAARQALPDRPGSPRYEMLRADQVDPETLFDLDTRLRQSVPGTDGWRGDRAWFDAELHPPAFDPETYLVARERASGVSVGLIRFWREPAGASLGLLGVIESHRSGVPALMLLRAGLEAAHRWQFETFNTHTARPRLQARLRRMGAQTAGHFGQYVLG